MQSIPTRVIAVAVATLFVVSACSGNDDDVQALPEAPADESTTSSSSSSTTSSSSSSTSSTTSPTPADTIPTPDDGEVFDAYIADRVKAFYELVNLAFEAPSPSPETDYPELTDVAAGEQLELLYERQRTLAADGQSVQEPSEPAVGTSTAEEFRVSRVVEDLGGQLKVRACEVDDEELVDDETGDVLITGVITIDRTLTLEQIEGQWKVTFIEVTDKVEGIGGCFFATETDLPY